jgi:hypothetical protein
MHLTETLMQVEGLPRMPFHPQVQKSLLRLMLLRDGISVGDIACAIAEWTPIEQLWHLEFLFLKISRRIDPAIKSEPQYSIRASGKFYRVDFKLSLRDEVLPSLPSIISNNLQVFHGHCHEAKTRAPGESLPVGRRDTHQDTEERRARKRARAVLEQRSAE